MTPDGTLLHLMGFTRFQPSLSVVLMCHGKQTRMGDYDGYKHLVPVCGEPLVQRTVRMLRRMAESAFVRFVAPDVEAWQQVAQAAKADLVSTPHPLFLAALPQVIPTTPRTDRTLVLCGDVVFSPEILEKLVHADAPVAFAGRFVPNVFTGRPAGELFGFSVQQRFLAQFIERVDLMVKDLSEMRAQVQAVAPDQVEAVMEKNLRLWLLMHELEDAGLAQVIGCSWTDYIDDIDGPDDLERLPEIEEVIKRRRQVSAALEAP